MKDIRPTRGASMLQRMIAEGEHVHQDFKYTISDARKIARSLSAFANNEGGRLLIGVKDNGIIAGVRNEEDVFVVEEAAEIYCDPPQHVEFKALKARGGLEVIIASIEASQQRPVRVKEADSSPRAYFRVADENIAAHPLMVECWEAGNSATAAALTPLHNAILTAVARKNRLLDLLELAIEVHASNALTRNAVIDLAASGLLSFTYNHGNFYLTTDSE
ncbi:MAG: ATP-binding protein [Bacteroidales bacterium]|nr:ATP-binding protein [Bacteroidales bacterium]